MTDEIVWKGIVFEERQFSRVCSFAVSHPCSRSKNITGTRSK